MVGGAHHAAALRAYLDRSRAEQQRRRCSLAWHRRALHLQSAVAKAEARFLPLLGCLGLLPCGEPGCGERHGAPPARSQALHESGAVTRLTGPRPPAPASLPDPASRTCTCAALDTLLEAHERSMRSLFPDAPTAPPSRSHASGGDHEDSTTTACPTGPRARNTRRRALRGLQTALRQLRGAVQEGASSAQRAAASARIAVGEVGVESGDEAGWAATEVRWGTSPRRQQPQDVDPGRVQGPRCAARREARDRAAAARHAVAAAFQVGGSRERGKGERGGERAGRCQFGAAAVRRTGVESITFSRRGDWAWGKCTASRHACISMQSPCAADAAACRAQHAACAPHRASRHAGGKMRCVARRRPWRWRRIARRVRRVRRSWKLSVRRYVWPGSLLRKGKADPECVGWVVHRVARRAAGMHGREGRRAGPSHVDRRLIQVAPQVERSRDRALGATQSSRAGDASLQRQALWAELGISDDTEPSASLSATSRSSSEDAAATDPTSRKARERLCAAEGLRGRGSASTQRLCAASKRGAQNRSGHATHRAYTPPWMSPRRCGRRCHGST